jgi:hypothetical protein
MAGQALVAGLVGGAAFLTVVGAFLPCFNFKINGLIGILSDFGSPGSADVDYSLWHAMWALTYQADAGETLVTRIGIWTIAIIGLAFAFLVPVCQLLVQLALWWVPLRLVGMKRLFVVNEVLSAWSALEIFLVAIMVALVELGQISGFLIGKNCRFFQPMLDTMQALDLVDEVDATCFKVDATTSVGCYVLIAAAVLANVAGQVVMRLAEAAAEERERRIKGTARAAEDLQLGCGRMAMLAMYYLGAVCCAVKISKRQPSGRAAALEADLRSSLTGEQQAQMDGTGLTEDLAEACAQSPRLRGSMTGSIMSTASPGGDDIRRSLRASMREEELPEGEGWTATMWQGRVVYWNSLTGQTCGAGGLDIDLDLDGDALGMARASR